MIELFEGAYDAYGDVTYDHELPCVMLRRPSDGAEYNTLCVKLAIQDIYDEARKQYEYYCLE